MFKLAEKARRNRFAAKAGFDPGQPRVPAGNPDGGQWTDAGVESGDGDIATAEDSFGDAGAVVLAGGFTDDQLDLPVQTFIAMYCKGSVNRVLPGQFRTATIATVVAAARQGDRDAATCLKLLMRDKYRK